MKDKKRNLMALSKSLLTSSSGFRTFGAGFFSCGGEVMVGIFFGGEEEEEVVVVCFATPAREGL